MMHRIQYEVLKAVSFLWRMLGFLTAREYDIWRQRLKETYRFRVTSCRENEIHGPESWGEDHKDVRFLVIRRRDAHCGLFSHFISNLGWVKYAEEHGMVPVIDMESEVNLYRKAGEGNPWEWFFTQPAGYGLADIHHAHCVYISGVMPYDRPDDRMCSLLHTCPTVWHDLASRCFRLSENVRNDVARYEQSLFNGSGNVLGVLIRGTDYCALRPPGHPIQPDVDTAIRDVRVAFDAGGYDRVFLVTEDRTIEERFRLEFGTVLRVTDSQLPDYHLGTLLGESWSEWGSSRVALDYCVRIVLLSRCRSLMAGRTSGAVAAAILSNGFELVKYWDFGRYPFPEVELRHEA